MIWRFISACVLVFTLAFTAAADERINSYDVIIDVQKDGDFIVTETISVNAEGRQIRRGIFRDLPRFKLDDGDTIPYQYKILSVTRNGKKEPFRNENQGNAKNVRIGDADVFLPSGEHVYEIQYEVKNEVRYFDSYDEVYWNVTGTYWAFPIDMASATIKLPPGANIQEHSTYTGSRGSTGSDAKYSRANGNYVFTTTRPFKPREGLTVSLTFDKGLIDPPSAADKRTVWWFKNGAIVLLSLSLLGIFLYYIRSWSKVGRDPDKDPVFARYEAPQGYSPAAVSYVRSRGLGNANERLIATLIGLATKKRLKIETTKKTTTLTHLDHTHGPLLNKEEAFLEKKLFPSSRSSTITLKKKPNSRFHTAQSKFNSHLAKNYGTSYFRWNMKYIIFGIIISVAAIILSLSQAYGSPKPATVWIILGLIAANILFIFLMPAPTKIGQILKAEIEGFKLYLKTAEESRLNAVEVGSEAPPPMTTERYEAFLPYAVALDVEKPWTKHFEKTLPQEAKDYNPGWTNMRSGSHGDLSRMTSSMVSNMNSGVSSAAPQSSSSSGGGGFSGGGGGGGGGGGW